MKTRVGIVLVTIILGVLGASILVSAECPNCFKNVKPIPAHHGTVNGRTRVNVQVATSGAGAFSPAAANTIVTGANGANSDWNDQTTTGAPGGDQNPYFLETNQNAAQGDVDIRIVMGTPSPGFVAEARGTESMGLIGKPWTITLPASAANLPPQILRAWIAHEIGHALGLAHPASFNECGHTIMNHLNKNNQVITGSVQAKDIAEIRRHVASPFTCPVELDQKVGLGNPTPTPTPNPTPTPPGGCVDQDHDGVCFFDDCDDNDPNVAFDSDGDHYCYPYDCDDYDSRVYPGAPLNFNTEGGEDRDCNGVDDYVQQFGGGGGPPGGGGHPCTPYYWVYYESMDGGMTWYIVDISYAGCW
jgi:hypothetical protein